MLCCAVVLRLYVRRVLFCISTWRTRTSGVTHRNMSGNNTHTRTAHRAHTLIYAFVAKVHAFMSSESACLRCMCVRAYVYKSVCKCLHVKIIHNVFVMYPHLRIQVHTEARTHAYTYTCTHRYANFIVPVRECV